MGWLAENWFIAFLFIAFIAMHLFGRRHGDMGDTGTKARWTTLASSPRLLSRFPSPRRQVRSTFTLMGAFIFLSLH